MRSRSPADGVLSVLAVGGTHVVMLGIDIAPAARHGLLGFAIHRTDHTENEAYWLPGMRTFEAVYPDPPTSVLVSTREHPVQDFLWSDFSAKPGYHYTYRVAALYGRPRNLYPAFEAVVEVFTEREVDGVHSVHFNRGVIGSQAYVRKWSKVPTALPPAQAEAAWRWLSRGLEEALLGFIGQAVDGGWALRVAAYEFSHAPVALALAQARARGADVRIVYDARTSRRSDGTSDPDEARRVAAVEALLDEHGLRSVAGAAVPRRTNPGYIAHNKFIVLLERDRPVAVWTGSTNFTRSGLFGQANVGHVVRDASVAQAYLRYWDGLAQDPAAAGLRGANEALTPTPALPPAPGCAAIFSPRAGLGQLQWYADLLDSAQALSCLTAAFGVNPRFLDDYAQDKPFLRYLFLEKWGVTPAATEAARAQLSIDPDVQVAVGATFDAEAPPGWRRELLNTISGHVKYVHTKFLLVDPLGDDPTVVTGSANFSDASTTNNDENMLVIRGDTRVADIYLGEFMRLWRHHRFRNIVRRTDPALGVERPNYLAPDDRWVLPFFQPEHVKFKRRRSFSAGGR
jgi:phosphatidylserine/phosphatidylglycerophosphate/cardiolipin synthase-like enzyme